MAVPGDEPAPEIPGYEIERLLGRGGMGAVWLEIQAPLFRVVPLLVLESALAFGAWPGSWAARST